MYVQYVQKHICNYFFLSKNIYVQFIFSSVPEKANTKSYTVLEINCFIHIWYHAEGIEPNWTPPDIEEITKGKWIYRGRTEHIVNSHIEVRTLQNYNKTYTSSEVLSFWKLCKV